MSIDIETKVRNRKVVKLFRDLLYDLDRASPNGALNHDRAGYRGNLIGWSKLFEKRGLEHKQFETYKKYHPEFYAVAINLVIEGKEKYKLFI